MFKFKNILLFSTSTLLLVSASLFAKDFHKIEKTLYEVIKNPDGSELVFKANGIKPQIILEEKIIITNEQKSREKIDFVKKISESMFFFGFDETKKITALYSKDGQNYHEKLNRLDDHYIKVTITDVLPNEVNSIKIRYEHNLFGISE